MLPVVVFSSPHGAVNGRRILQTMKGLVFCFIATVMLTAAQGKMISYVRDNNETVYSFEKEDKDGL